MQSDPESCTGDSGCMRPNGWPDLPSTSVLKCQGQCRNGAAGQGPTDPRWIHAYCIVTGNFFNIKSKTFEQKTFNLCKHELVSDESIDGVSVTGLDGKWSSKERDSEEFKATWTEYAQAGYTSE